jgi:hypothetical protein
MGPDHESGLIACGDIRHLQEARVVITLFATVVLQECLVQIRFVAAARRPGKKAIAGKSRVAATPLQRLSVVFLTLAMIGCTFFSDIHGKESLTKSDGKLSGRPVST